MKTTSTDIPVGSLAAQFLPADHNDAYYCSTLRGKWTADDLMVAFWTDMPAWVSGLFRLRNALVRVVGLKRDSGDMAAIERCIREGGTHGSVSVPARSPTETVLMLTDKHLDAYISAHLADRDAERIVTITTLVKYHNRLGRFYFFVIRPFHAVVVRSMIKRIVRRLAEN